MCGNNSVFTQCDVCGRDIHYGNAVLEIERNVEQHDYEEETDLHSVTVIDAESLLTLCARCGNSLANREEIWKHLVSLLSLPSPATTSDAGPQTEEGLPETCSRCGVELEVGKARVALVRLIGQMDWSDELNDGELFVIEGEDILSFCPKCGSKMSTHCLRQALHEMIDDVAVPERMEYAEMPPVCACGGLQPIDSATTCTLAAEEQERRLDEWKSQLLRRALEKADEMDMETGFTA